MIVERLSASHFRNFSSLDVAFSSGVNIFFGDNGAGKTNLLEAIFVLCLGRSQRSAADSTLVQHGQEVYRLEGAVSLDGRVRELAVAYQRNGRKKISLDGVPVKAAELFQTVCAVSSGPEDSGILSGAPSARRNFIDIYLSQYSRSYLDTLRSYLRVLEQKNAALKTAMDTTAFDTLVTTYGAQVISAREAFIKVLRERATRHYASIADGETLDLQYESCVPSGMNDTAAIQKSLSEALTREAGRERAAGMAMIGPHRDELAVTIGKYPARSHGSQGQWRTAAVALKLSVYELLKEKRAAAPVLLLDEIFAELDSGRARRLIEAFSGYRQLFLTTAVDPPEPLRSQGRRYYIAQGKVEALS